MRLTLFFILLFSMLGGSPASASHSTVSSQVFHYSIKQTIFSFGLNQARCIDSDTVTEFFTADDDIEDDEDKENLSFRKCKIPASITPASYHIITLSRLHGYNLPVASVRNSSSGKYILQRKLRV